MLNSIVSKIKTTVFSLILFVFLFSCNLNIENEVLSPNILYIKSKSEKRVIIFFSGLNDSLKLLKNNHSKFFNSISEDNTSVILIKSTSITPNQKDIKVLSTQLINIIQNPNHKNIILGGFSAGGINSIYLCKELIGKISIKKLFLIDCPLDMDRFYKSLQAQYIFSNNEIARLEAKEVIKLFNKESVEENDSLNKFLNKNSIFIHGQNVQSEYLFLKDLKIKLYYNLEPNWQSEYRNRSLYDLHIIDAYALIQLSKYNKWDNVSLYTNIMTNIDNPHTIENNVNISNFKMFLKNE
jgi:hypothetical protein